VTQTSIWILAFSVLMGLIGMVDLDSVLEGIKRKKEGNPLTGYEFFKTMVFHFSYWTLYLGAGCFIRQSDGMEAAQLFWIPSIVLIGLFMFVRRRAMKLDLDH
jgi:hypothetical protein